MNVILYARVSTDRQAEKDLSIPAQLRLMRDHARQQGWTVVEELVEPGVSATNTDRPVLQSMLKRVVSGAVKADIVLAHKLNRLARNLDDYIPIRAALWKHGIRLAYVVERVDETAAGRLLENVMASIAQFESANLSEETKKGMRQKVLQGGWPHRPPRGYVAVRQADEKNRGSHCEVHPRQGPLVTKAFEMFATGHVSIDTVAMRLAADGMIGATGKPLVHSHLHHILTNPFYVGIIEWQGLRVKGAHQPLVSQGVFDRVQEVIRQRYVRPLKHRTINGFPLKGLAICGRCRGNMTAERHGRFGYYRCVRQANRHAACDARYCRADRAHRDVVNILDRIQLSRRTADLIRAEAERLISDRDEASEARRRELDELRAASVASQSQLTESFLAGDVPLAAFQHGSFAVAHAAEALGREFGPSDSSPDQLRSWVRKALDLSTSVRDIYERFDDWRRTALLRAVLTSVVIGADGVLGFTLRSPFDAFQRAEAPASQAEAILRMTPSDLPNVDGLGLGEAISS